MITSRAPPIGDLAHNPDMCPDWESNQRPFGLQAGVYSTGPHQPGSEMSFRGGVEISVKQLHANEEPKEVSSGKGTEVQESCCYRVIYDWS